ncbi:MAG: ABC transporter permease [Pseudomonadota bacterium]|nr:ABC transporter permease [Pseudomonadota bacterium]
MVEPSIQLIPYSRLLWAMLPVLVVVWVLFRWALGGGNALYALLRMMTQLLLVGNVLVYMFRSDSPWIVLLVLSVMVLVSSWITLRTVRSRRRALYGKALLSILIGGTTTLVLVTQAVLSLQPWYMPHYVIPLAGMIFSGVMNSVSLAAERLAAEMSKGMDYLEARRHALNASLIPITNSLFGVGLVSLPGMMTGQILAGVSPLVAVNYQVMVMLMIFGSAGLASVSFLLLARKDFEKCPTNQ